MKGNNLVVITEGDIFIAEDPHLVLIEPHCVSVGDAGLPLHRIRLAVFIEIFTVGAP